MLFNPATAKAAAVKSVQVRRERRNNPPVIPPLPLLSPLEADYVTNRIARTRAHIEAIDRDLAGAVEPMDKERLARALALLQGVEADLSGRPKPGALRPREPKSSTSGGY